MDNKKTGILVGIFIVILLVIAFLVEGKSSDTNKVSNNSGSIMENLQRESAAVTDSEKGEFTEQISVSKFDELYKQEGMKYLVLVARPTCGYCELVEPVLRKIIKDYNVSIYYLNTDEFSDEDNSNFIKYNDDWSKGYGTPMLLLVGDNKIIDMIDGATDTASYLDFLKNYELIKE